VSLSTNCVRRCALQSTDIKVYDIRRVRSAFPLHAIGCYFTDHLVVCSGLHCIQSRSQSTAINSENRTI
jgi:hypothetical protein